ncbi:hypothetical protein CPC08DRAFT_819377 [Agrocybe pediades]|nr:hypothetical protein CPC08DRAFT_819377 [Agrocybe pediades]
MATFTNEVWSSHKPCRTWAAQGRCRFGSNCKFSHEQGVERPRLVSSEEKNNADEHHTEPTHNLQEPSASASPVSPPTMHNSTNKAICRDWRAKRQCPRGVRCRFSHEIAPNGKYTRKQSHSNSVGGRVTDSTFKGKHRSDRRDDLHIQEQPATLETPGEVDQASTDPEEERAKRVQAEKGEKERRDEQERLAREAAAKEVREKRREQQAREAAVIEQHVVLDSSLVTFSAGLEILHVIPGFNLRKITIKNLPADARRQEIADIFLPHVPQARDFCITQFPNAASPNAIVLVDEEYGQAIAAGLEEADFRGVALDFTMSESATGTEMGEAAARQPVIMVSWDAPSDTIIVTYASMEEAREKVRTLNMKNWKGRQLRVFMNQPPPRAVGLRSYRFNPPSIKILGLPHVTVLDGELFEFLGSTNIRTLRSTNFDFPDSFDIIRQRLLTCNGVQMDTYEVVDDGKRGEARVKVQFAEWEDAKSAHTVVLCMSSGPPKFRPWVPQQPLRYTIKIPRQQYDAQKRQWDQLSEKKDVDAYVQAKIGARGDVFVQVLGQDKKAIGALKVRVERMVAGEKLDATCWHSSFMSGEGRRFLNRIFEEKRVVIRHDFKSKSLRAYGEPRMIEEVRRMVQEEVERLSQSEITRDIFGRGIVGFFVREGLGKLTELLGEGNVNLDLTSRPCKITVKGGDEAKHHLQRLIDESRAKTSYLEEASLSDSSATEACPICMDEVSNAEELGCGHTYCSGCLKLFLTSAADGKKFPITCIANDSSCNVPLSIPFIKRFLPMHAFQGLVEAVFLLYLDQHAQEFKYCTTPDCKQIYRHTTDAAILKCPSCFSTICAACDREAHEGISCEEREQRELHAQDKALADQGYKKCPACKVWIEKTAGCNHMSCKCGAHICWKCMGLFPAGEIYRHMSAAHGGFFDNEPPAFNPANDANFLVEQVRALNEIERRRNATPHNDLFGEMPPRVPPERAPAPIARDYAQFTAAQARALNEFERQRDARARAQDHTRNTPARHPEIRGAGNQGEQVEQQQRAQRALQQITAEREREQRRIEEARRRQVQLERQNLEARIAAEEELSRLRRERGLLNNCVVM